MLLSQKFYTVVLCMVQATSKLPVSSYGNTVINDEYSNSAGMSGN